MIVDMVNLRLSAQRALLGNVFPELRAVCVDSKENLISVHFYVDGKISEEKKEHCESVLDEIIADFCHLEGIEFETPIVQLDYPQTLPIIGYRVYRRYEA